MAITRRDLFKATLAAGTLSTAGAATRPPNVVIVFLDDSGFSDFRPFGKTPYATPNVEKLASQGTCFQQFYVPQAVCSASRSALLSGCYPGRTKVVFAHRPGERGLDPKFATMGEVFRGAGYKTAAFGKWHIGDQPDTRPPARGFDESCGLMYSNDMWEFHPENPKSWGKYPLQFWDNGKVTIDRMTKQHQPMLTTWYTEHAVSFIERNRSTPFLLYLAHSMPHVPLFCSEKFLGKSGHGLYADVIQEIDWSVGQVTAALERAGVADNTIVVFTSDNGPWASYGNHAGKTPYRESKSTGFDGGTRSACIIRYPGQVRAGAVSKTAFCSIDLLPTLAKQAGAKLPANPIDGKDVWDLITGKPGATNPQPYYPFSTGPVFEGVISGDGRWKLHLAHNYQRVAQVGNDGVAGKYETAHIDLSLFDLNADAMESHDVQDSFPNVLAQMRGFAAEHMRQFYPDQKP